jgi:hypothetical protein
MVATDTHATTELLEAVFFCGPRGGYIKKKTVALVRKRTIPYRPTAAVGEVSANFLRIEGLAWSAQRIPTAVNFSVF